MMNRAKWRLILAAKRMKRRLFPPNATCNACGYRGRRTARGIWCPACWEDENGELIRDRRPAARRT